MVSLMLRNLEELHGVAEVIAFETLGAENRIRKGDRDRRVVGAHQRAFVRGPVLDFVEGGQTPMGVALEELDPAVESLLLAEATHRFVGLNVGYATELI
jgi:hypothetical protein